MSDFTRDFAADLEIRSDGSGRTVHGIVVPWDSPARVSDGGAPYTEQFQRGAFTKHLNERTRPVKLLSQHNRDKPLGVSTVLREDASGLYGEFKVSNTQFGNDQLELVRDGALDSFSVGFTPVKHIKRDGVLVRTEAKLRETSLVTFPAYAGALVGGVRALSGDDAALANQLLLALVSADAQLDPIVEALCAADGALDQAQSVIAQLLAIPDPDPEDAEPDEMAEMNAHSSLTSLARRLDAALAARASATPSGAGESEPLKHSGRLIVARNNLRAALIERGIK